MVSPAACLPDLRRAARLPLSEDERVMRDVAFRGLPRCELVNLLTRRLWAHLRRVNPANWRFRRAASAPGNAMPAGVAER
jgi:hypothetical protein